MSKPARRKQRNRGNAAKPRDEWIKLQARRGPEGVSFHIDKKTGTVFCPQAIPGTVTSYQSYGKASGGEKIVYQASSDQKTASFLLRHELLSRFDVICGIDTNTYDIEGRILSIAFSFVSAPTLRRNADHLRMEPASAFIFEDIRNNVNPEVVAWYHFFTNTLPRINNNDLYDVALVVDSELRQHPAINARSAPYYRNFMLPSRTQIIYASADTGTDLPNKLIKQCDKNSRKLADKIRRKEIMLPPNLGAGWEDYRGAIRLDFSN